ncbi:HmuY family protein [Porphyromonas sp.]|uniref:HmuY family protein n=1 Tax=Porphyromonas sp. TaxID=1924944 RepID=UPI0026DAD054|nr:HmuY family protein [Porphyromonas sp.]MDO4771783.1 HmuY family protein [Porphyromonas sp.]
MNKTIFTVALILTAGLLSLTSCDKKGSEPTPPNGSVKEYMQSKTTQVNGEWIYFSFATGKEVAGVTEANYKERLDWDIAINTFFFRTNSGKSGKGKGGAIITDKTELSALTEAPKDGYHVDEDFKVLGYQGRVIEVQTTANVELNGTPKIQLTPTVEIQLGKAISFYGAPPTYIYKADDHVFVIRTADGKYAKVKFIGYKNAEGTPGYVSFKYVYQSDGSTTFGK